jgi:hypothetical protein
VQDGREFLTAQPRDDARPVEMRRRRGGNSLSTRSPKA